MGGGDCQSQSERFEQFNRRLRLRPSMPRVSTLAIRFADMPVSAAGLSSDKPMSCRLMRTASLSS